MTSSTPPTVQGAIAQSEGDAQTLNVLSIFYFVAAGLHALGSCAGLVYLWLGLAWLAGAGDLAAPSQGQGPTPAETKTIGMVLTVFGGVALGLSLLCGTLLLLTGFSLRRHTRFTLCIVTAAIICLSIPLGTALGVVTLVLLNRPTTKMLFAR